MDLDRFKNLNDSRGHNVGDQLLIQLADRLVKMMRPADTLARLGGDEFTFLLEDISGLDQALYVMSRVLEAFQEPFSINNDEVYTNASIGVCMSSMDYQSSNEMLRDADIAMYRAKSNGKGRVDVFNPEMRNYAIETLQIENDLRSALKKDQFEIYYQPVIDIHNHTIDGFEALLRWKHPSLGYIPPDRFISVAEHMGAIQDIGIWVLENACLQVQNWNKQYQPSKHFSIAVNLSALQLTESGIHQKISCILKETCLPAKLLHLEVTETTLVAHREEARESIHQLQEMGISVSIDDFGKGYCSLSYLQEFNFNTLKIDKDYVQDMTEEGKGVQLVTTLLSLAENLNLTVVAEGVETKDQLQRLTDLNCQYVQGYYYSRPHDANHISNLLSK